MRSLSLLSIVFALGGCVAEPEPTTYTSYRIEDDATGGASLVAYDDEGVVVVATPVSDLAARPNGWTGCLNSCTSFDPLNLDVLVWCADFCDEYCVGGC